ncbi:ArsB/NhaD family transporter [Alpinimonas psychrophila]|uniref:Na+/H+ antiporter NhaD/arsenite permease-like protein n=1 Tax=Alpinimonas psychrophila TaxID=748908 RepID=A0A7W3PPL2_9MICO|nr:SLC13 family permease [Alpinimonas psychrophila]MBA8829396.1 Na+/H+ antiporter NhaD/arsenite permease-like protein [Alpinimonas psychrophila]
MIPGTSYRGLIAAVTLLVASVIVVATGILPWNEFVTLKDRVIPVLGFVVAITVVTELAAAAGVFAALVERLAQWGFAKRWILWLFVLGLATVSTIFLSLDTTAVLVTPVVVLLAIHVGMPPMPFALATIWLANTASLLLPVSNLTNLLAETKMAMDGPVGFAALVWAPALVGILVPVAVLSVMFRRSLRGAYVVPPRSPVNDRHLLLVSAAVLIVLLPFLVSGLPVWMPATVAAIVLVIVFAVRQPASVSGLAGLWLVPWRPVAIAFGLFVLVDAAQVNGLAAIVGTVAGSGTDFFSLLQLSALGTLVANGINNLPAYLVLEPVGTSSVRLAALLIGVNLGPLITPWASLATLLWYQKVSALGVRVSWGKFALAGLVVVAVTIPLGTLALLAVAQ